VEELTSKQGQVVRRKQVYQREKRGKRNRRKWKEVHIKKAELGEGAVLSKKEKLKSRGRHGSAQKKGLA